MAERGAMDKLLGRAARKDAVCPRLMTIPGVAPITSLAFRATPWMTQLGSPRPSHSALISA